MEKKGAKNGYVCQECHTAIVTENVVDGVTPFSIMCKATKGCPGTMFSRFYNIPQSLPAQWEWFRPDDPEKYSEDVQDHIRNGGLLLRRKDATTQDDLCVQKKSRRRRRKRMNFSRSDEER